MPATSKFKIPFQDGKPQQITSPSAVTLVTNLPVTEKENIANINNNNNSDDTTSSQSSDHGNEVEVTSPFQIIHLERHHYSMIKYTKMVTNVTFK